mgnify:FL=1
MKQVTMVTGNLGKLKVAKEIFKAYNIELLHEKMDTFEIQSMDVCEVSKYSALYASKKLNKDVIKSDVGYYIEELNGFPGPFLRYINETLTSSDIIKMMEGKTNRKIILKECLTYASKDGKIKQFINEEEATLSNKPYGSGTTFDKIVILKEDALPKSMNKDEKNYRHFEKTLTIYNKMAEYLENL